MLRRHWPIVLPVILVLSVFHAWVFPGLLLGADWVRRVPGEMYWYWPWPHVWNPAQQMGESNAMYLSSFPVLSLVGLASHLHVSWPTIERLFFFWPYLVVSVVSPYAFAYRLTRSPYGASLAASLVTVNTWVIMAAERGAIPSLIAAWMLPLFWVLAIRFIEQPSVRRGMWMGLLLTLVLVYDLRYVYIGMFFAGILAAEQLLRDRSFARARAALTGLAAAAVTIFVTNLFWILPQFSEVSSAGAGYGSTYDYILNSHYMRPAHSVSAFAVFYHWVASNDPFTPTPPDALFYVLPVAVFAILTMVWRRKWVFSLAVGAAVSVLLCSGPSFPVDKINIFLFEHVPGMGLFRDVTKWMSLLEITYATIVAYGIARLCAYIRLKMPPRTRRAIVAVPVLAIGAYALLMADAYNPMRYRVFSTYHVHGDVTSLESFLQSGNGYYRTLVFPRDSEPMRAVTGHPYIEGLQFENSQPTDGFRYLNLEWDTLYGLFSAPFAADLLREMNVKYVVVPYDYDKVIYQGAIANWSYYDALQFIKTRPWLKFVTKIGRQWVFELRDSMPSRAFIAPAPFVLNGSGFTLAGLAGTPLIGSRMAALMLDQPLNRIARRIPNYVSGAWAIDTNLYSQKQSAVFINRARLVQKQAEKGAFQYYAAVTSAAANAPHVFDGDEPLLIDTTMRLPRSGTAEMRTNVVDVSRTSPLLVNETFFRTRPRRFRFDNRAEAMVFSGTMAVRALGAGLFTIANVNPARLVGDLYFDSAYIHGRSTRARIALNGQTWDFSGATRSFVLHEATLEPGTNIVKIRTTKGQPALRPGKSCVLRNERLAPGRREFWGTMLVSNVKIPLDSRPFVRLTYDWVPKNGGTPAVLFTLRSREDGALWYYTVPVSPKSGMYEVQLQADLTTAQHERWQRELAEHAHDPRWLFGHRLRDEPDGAGAFDLESVAFVAYHPKSETGLQMTQNLLRARRLVIWATPANPEMAAADGRNVQDPRSIALPAAVEVSGFIKSDERNTPELYEQTYIPVANAAQHRLVVRAPVTPGVGGVMQFNFFQSSSYKIRISVRLPNGKTIRRTIRPDDGSVPVGLGGFYQFDPSNISWITGIPHCLPTNCASAGEPIAKNGQWRKVRLDLSYLLRDPVKGRVSVEMRYLPLGKRAGPVTIAFTPARTVTPLGNAGTVPALLLNGNPVRYVRRDSIDDGSAHALTGEVTLSSRVQRVQSFPSYPVRPVSTLLAQGHLKKFQSASLTNERMIVPEEFTGDLVSHGGLLVFTQQWDPEWKLALVPRNFRLTGNALVDNKRVRPYLLPATDHYVVNDVLNGWWMPSGRYHLVFIFALQATIETAAVIWLAASAIWIAAVLAVTRRSAGAIKP